jgi:hypothetical protein
MHKQVERHKQQMEADARLREAMLNPEPQAVSRIALYRWYWSLPESKRKKLEETRHE